MAGIPQVITEDRASGAQFIDGSLRFDSSKGYCLKRTFTSNGNQRAWTWSGWVKRGSIPTTNVAQSLMGAYSDGNNRDVIRINGEAQDKLSYQNGVATSYQSSTTDAVIRDTGWYHIVISVDLSQGGQAARSNIYVNGRYQSVSTAHGSGRNSMINSNLLHYIGARSTDGNPSAEWDGEMSQIYFIDGQTLGPGYFGFTDPLTGIWRPKKFRAEGITVNDGTNWSSSVSNAANSATNLFDGSTSTYTEGNVNGTPVTWSGNVSGSKIEFYGYQAGTSRTFTVNGVDRLSLVPTSAGWFTIPDLTTLTAFTFSRGSSGNYVDLFAVRVDGVIMTNNTTQNLQFGTNGFYLPMDGNTPIGKDQSGNGNDWTPVKFGGSVTLDNPTVSGAIPILNTNDAGTVAKRDVRTDSKTYTVTASGGNYYLDGALKPTLNAYRGSSLTFDYTGATSHPFYLSSLQDGKHNSKAYSSRLYRSGGYLDLGTGHTDLQPGSGDFCIELYVNLVNQGANYPVFVDNRVTGYADANGFFWGLRDADNRIYFYTHGNTRIYADHSLTTGKWYHLALTRQSGTFRMFIDGRQVGVSYSQSQNYTNQIRYIGHSTNSESQTWYIDAYISNFRFVKGEAVYTTNFTPPQTTLTTTSQGVSSSNVKLLCCQDSSPTTAVVSPGTITLGQAGSDAVTSVNTHNPFLYNSVHGNFGVNTATSNTTKITIPHTAADTLYYYCENHSGMGSSINVTTDIRKADPYAWKCVLANSLVGSANDVSNQINSGTTEKVMTVSGATANTAGNFYGGSYKFVAASSQQITTPGSSDFAFGTGDFCVECWYYNNTSGGGTTYNQLVGNIESSAEGFWRIGSVFGGANKFWFTYTSGNYNDVFTTVNINDGKWHHLAATREGGTLRLFVDGVVSATATVTQHFSQTTTLRMMYSAQQPGYANGYLQDVRIYKGLAKYNENFVVGSTAPDVLPDSPSGITGKTNLTKITAGAVTGFESNSDYLSVAASNDFVFDGDHTIELFVYHRTLSDDSVPWSTGGSGQPDQIYIGTNGICNYGYSQTGVVSAPAGTIVVGRWQHIAVSKQGTNLRLFVDGKIVASSTNHSSSVGRSSNDARIGNRIDGGNAVRGFISNLRIVKGTALYTSEFTPPTEPLTNVTNTVLLCCQSTTSAVAAAVAPGSITANGDAAANNFNPFTDDINTIRGQETGYATLNSIDPRLLTNGPTYTLSNGNLTCDMVGGNTNASGSRGFAASTLDLPSGGKWYCEYYMHSLGNDDIALGIASDIVLGYYIAGGNPKPGAYMVRSSGIVYSPTFQLGSDSSRAYTTGDLIGVSVDLESATKTITFYKNGISTYNTTVDETQGPFKFVIGCDPGGSTAYKTTVNFGQKPFKYTPPDGFQPLNLSTTQPEKVIARPDQYVDVSLWSGNGTSQNITGLKHKPDFVWIKKRAGGTARSHQLFDSVRGVYKTLHSDSTSAEDNNTNRLTAFNRDGFAVGGDDGCNGSNGTFVGWTWKAGGNNGQFNIDDVGYANASDVNMNAGALNSVSFDKSQNWTSQITGTQNGSYPFANMFNADGQATHAYPANGTRATFTPSPSFSNAKTVKVWYYAPSINADTFQLNGVNVGDQMTTTSGTLTKTFNVDGFTSWSWSKGVGGDDSGMLRIDVDGVQLVDSGVSTPNVPSIAATGSSVGTKQGFSIVSYTAAGGSTASIPHGLEQSPDFVIIKNRDGGTSGSAGGWYSIYHDGFTHNHMYGFNDVSSSDSAWNNHGKITGTTSNVVQVANGDHSSANNWWTHSNGADYIMYSWHNVPGLQKFGTYTGNGSPDGPFIELGFKPAIFWMKAATASGNWIVIDNKRPGYNPDQKTLCQNLVNAENASGGTTNDILSNGFKVRGTTDRNSNGVTYIYCAWAEAPSFNLYGAQANAR